MEQFNVYKFVQELNSIKVDKPEHRVVYHYTNIDALIKIITKKTLWFSDRSYLNDKSEGLLPLEICESVINELSLDDNLRTAIHEKVINKKAELNKSKSRVYILSFSTDSDSLCLWNYYTKGDSVQGFNIGFMADELTSAFGPSDAISTAIYPIQRQVIYTIEEQKEVIIQTINKLLRVANGKETDLVSSYIVDKIVYWGYFFKPKCFEIEHEYRMVISWDLRIPLEGYFLSDDEYREKGGLIIPYKSVEFKDLSCIKSVVISPTIDFELAEASLRHILTRNPTICIKKSDIPIRY